MHLRDADRRFLMLQHTFVHIPGVGPSTEESIWESGGRHWDEFLRHEGGSRLLGRRFETVAASIEESKTALKRRDSRYFWRRLPNAEHWRLFEEFADQAAFVDIETTGLSHSSDQITVVAMCTGDSTRTFVRGIDLGEFPAAIAAYPLLVTFNGACFDLPFLANTFRGFRPRAHIDLRYPLKRLGYSGGLKAVERRAGVTRPAHVRSLDGLDAVYLWNDYKAGSQEALDTLLEYARADVENLRPLARLAATRLARELGFTRRTCMWGSLSAP